MASAAVTIFTLMLTTTWKTIVDTPRLMKYPTFDQFLTSLPIVQGIAAAAAITFAPGLLDAVQSTTPPTIDFFKSLPGSDAVREIWGIYAIVLEKAGNRPRLYVGSGTTAKNGLHTRWKQYDTGDVLPRYIQESILQGFEITHKGLFCWAPRPDASFVPVRRLLFVAMECCIAYMFWAMKAMKGDYSMGHICLWDRRDLEYDGLCSHPSLFENVQGDFDLTPEQLEAKAEEAERRFREHKAINAQNYHHKQMAENYDEYMTNSCNRVAKSRALNPETHRKTEKARIQKDLSNKRYHCSTCNISFPVKRVLDDHMKSAKHKRKVNNNHKYFCKACNYGIANISNWNRHLKTERHKTNIAKLAEETADEPIDDESATDPMVTDDEDIDDTTATDGEAAESSSELN